MLNRNRYLRLEESASVLLVNNMRYGGEDDDYIVALHDSELLIVRENEIQIQ